MCCLPSGRRRGLSAIVGILILILIVVSTGLIVYNMVISFYSQSTASSGKTLDIFNYECSLVDMSTNTIKICIRNLGGDEVALDRAYIDYGSESEEAYIGQVFVVRIEYIAYFGENVTSVDVARLDNVNPGFITLNLTINFSTNGDNSDSLIKIYVDFGDGGGLVGSLTKEVGLADGNTSVDVVLDGAVTGVVEDGVIEGQSIFIDPGSWEGYGYIFYDKVFVEPRDSVVIWVKPIGGSLKRVGKGLKVSVTTYEGGVLVVNL